MCGLEKSSSRRDFLCKMIALVPTVSLAAYLPFSALRTTPAQAQANSPTQAYSCLLYTSDAADE